MKLYIDNSNVIELRALTNSVTGVVDTGATVTVTILDASGAEVAGQVWPAAMSHDSGGTYRATLESDLVFVNAGRYVAKVNAVGSGAEIGEWNCRVIAVDRGC